MKYNIKGNNIMLYIRDIRLIANILSFKTIIPIEYLNLNTTNYT